MSAVLEEVYENQSRDPGGSWSPSGTASTDAVSGGQCGDTADDTRVSGLSSRLGLQEGVAVPAKEEMACPQGWHVTSDWRVDMEGDVDEDGEEGAQHSRDVGDRGDRDGLTGIGVTGWG